MDCGRFQATEFRSNIDNLPIGIVNLASDCSSGTIWEIIMPDGSRKRRFSFNRARRQWYANHRARRFATRLGFAKTKA